MAIIALFFCLMMGANIAIADQYLVTKTKTVNMRMGPGRQYNIEWIYTRKFTPLKVLATTEGWVKVEDCEGTVGWMMSSLLYKKNYVATKTDKTRFWRNKSGSTPLQITADACVNMKVEKCIDTVCKIRIKNRNAWVYKNELWGLNN